MASARINKTVSFNADIEVHRKALAFAESKGFSEYVRELIIKAYLEKEG